VKRLDPRCFTWPDLARNVAIHEELLLSLANIDSQDYDYDRESDTDAKPTSSVSAASLNSFIWGMRAINEVRYGNVFPGRSVKRTSSYRVRGR